MNAEVPFRHDLVPALTAEQARAIMYAEIEGALTENILVACYCMIRSSAILGSRSICDDFAEVCEDKKAIVRSLFKVIAILEKQGFSCTLHKTSIDIEWEGAS